jgi:NADH-quinone oxidoreductase subunit M
MGTLLSFILLLPLFFAFLGAAFVRTTEGMRTLSMLSSFFVISATLLLWTHFLNFDTSLHLYSLEIFGLSWSLGVDGLVMAFLLLIALLMPICFLSIQGVSEREKEYSLALLVLQFCMTGVFLVQNILLFYVFFEAVLIPMYFIVGALGSRSRRVYAAYQLLLYTIFGSVPLLFAIIHIYLLSGSFEMPYLVTYSFPPKTEFYCWIAFFLGFAVKVPMVPFHIWLPEAHVEAPTAGSVVLAAILLKMGTYGFIRYSIPLFPEASVYFSPFVILLSGVAVVYTSLTTMRQVDLKKIVAYSSVAHMGIVTLGIFSFNPMAVNGAIFIMFSHAFVAGSLFLLIGVLYDRYKTRVYKYYSGLVQIMPIFTTFFLFFTMANLGLPGTSSFPGEFMILVASLDRDVFAAVVVTTGAVLSSAYALWAFNRFSFGVSKVQHIYFLSDVSWKEAACIFPLAFLTLFFGVYPDPLLKLVGVSLVY